MTVEWSRPNSFADVGKKDPSASDQIHGDLPRLGGILILSVPRMMASSML